MTLELYVDTSKRLQLQLNGRVWVRDIGVRISQEGEFLDELSGLTVGEWEQKAGHDRVGAFWSNRSMYFCNGEPLLRLDVRLYSDIAVIDAVLTRDLTGISRGDSFTTPGVFLPWFSIPEELSFLLTTFGLDGGEDDYPGGYWPTVKTGQGMDDLPEQAFSPLVLYDENAALAVAPGNMFLTSSLVKDAAGIGRGIHGAVDSLPTGTEIQTVFAVGKDVPEALMRLGDFLMARSGKSRPQSDSHPLLSRLGWWNAYGGYYTEPIRKLDAEGLTAILAGLREKKIPIGYLGLDLWYLYEQIGQAIRYVPDPKKYPHGIGKIARDAGVFTVLHLSALSKKNVYGANGSDPTFYWEVARELTREGAIVAWHDWLRTQQHLISRLRNDPTAADAWFAGMAKAFADSGLDVLLCMQTMGMNFASTQYPNIISGRTHTDYLFTQPEALAEAARRGHPEFQAGYIPARELHRQNLLMGMVLYALGMMPFHDLFLTREHPRLGGAYSDEEAVLRALSCGPVGIGDGPGMSDSVLIQRLLLPDGTLAHPDHPPFPVMSTLNSDVQAFFTEHRAGEVHWGYLLLLNTTDREAPFRIEPPLAGDFLFWDGLHNRVVSKIAGTLPAGRIAYFILVPKREGIGLLGLWDRFVPAEVRYMQEVVWNDGWHLKVSRSNDRIAVVSDGPIAARISGDKTARVDRYGTDVWLIKLDNDTDEVHISRR